MAVLTRTHTKTYTLLDPWAQTDVIPLDTPGLWGHAREGDLCCAEQCGETLVAGEVVYAVIELGRGDALPGRGEPWVCWRHVRPDEGPLKVTPYGKTP